MPTKCFFNLPEEKQMKIVGASMCELSRVPADKISINKIIKTAGISRGSFYQYFEDKSDLLDYIFSDFSSKMQSCINESLKKYNGNIFDMAGRVLEDFILLGKDEDNLNALKNFFLGMKFDKNNRISMLKLFNIPEKFFINKIMPYIEINKFRDSSEDFITGISELIILLMKQSFTDIFSDYQNRDIYKRDFYIQLDIIRHGAIKE